MELWQSTGLRWDEKMQTCVCSVKVDGQCLPDVEVLMLGCVFSFQTHLQCYALSNSSGRTFFFIFLTTVYNVFNVFSVYWWVSGACCNWKSSVFAPSSELPLQQLNWVPVCSEFHLHFCGTSRMSNWVQVSLTQTAHVLMSETLYISAEYVHVCQKICDKILTVSWSEGMRSCLCQSWIFLLHI